MKNNTDKTKRFNKPSILFPGIKFKSPELYNEFIDHQKTDPRVRSLALEIGLYANSLGYSLIISQIGRTAIEQIRIYGKDKKSGHRELPARAIDFGIKNIPMEIVMKLSNYFNFYLDSGVYYSLLYHNAGAGCHLHLQVPHKKYNKILWHDEKRK